MMLLKIILKISRPRFWLYTAGPFAVGLIAAADSWQSLGKPFLLLELAYFILPANLMLYGVNDLFDSETDRLNHKKQNQEYLLKTDQVFFLAVLVGACTVMGLSLAFLNPQISRKWWLLFLLLSWLYSAAPVRFKARPFLDFLSNILYIAPAGIAYSYLSGHSFSAPVLIAAWLWVGAMHLFSAIPDIKADRQAKIMTTAVLLGRNYSLILCGILWLLFCGVVFYSQWLWPFSAIALVYPIIIIYAWIKPLKIQKIYWAFPYLNGILGFCLFWLLAASKPY